MSKDAVRVAHIVGKWLGGGVEAVVMNYYTHLNHEKVQFDFICDSDSIDIPYDKIEELGGKVIIIPPYQKPFKYHIELKKVLKHGKYNIVHSHINTMSVFPLFAAKMAGVPVRIAHSHSTTNKKELKKNFLKQILRRFSKLFATDYFCCSKYAGKWMFGKKTYNKNQIYVLKNAIDLEKYKYDKKIREDKRKELTIADDTLVVGHVGRFDSAKNHEFLIDVFNEIHKKIDNSILILVGKGKMMEKVKNKINELNLTDSVLLLNQRNDVNELYQTFDIFLFPSLYEGLGISLIEAQCAGVMCVCSNEVPDEAKVTDDLHFLSLDVSPDIWATLCLDFFKTHKRKNNIKEVSKHGYNIEDEVIKLEEYYLNRY